MRNKCFVIKIRNDNAIKTLPAKDCVTTGAPLRFQKATATNKRTEHSRQHAFDGSNAFE